MTTPTRAAAANDLGERGHIAVGDFIYNAKVMPRGEPWLRLKPQLAHNPNAVYIGSDRSLSMRDYDAFSRVYLNDFRGGGGQITFDPSRPDNRNRFYDSANADPSPEGEVRIIRAFSSLYSGDTTAIRKPMVIAGGYLYVASFSKVGYSNANDWSSPAFANCATSGTIGNTITGLATDGQYVYGTVSAGGGAGINRWAINNTAAGTLWNVTSTTPRRIIYANRKLYAIDATQFYEVAVASGTGTVDFTLPTGWQMQDLCALRGGAIDAPILVLATNGTIGSNPAASAIWYWDGTTVHDYMALPNGFTASRMKQYLGVIYVTGSQLMPSSAYANVAYAVIDGSLSFLGYLAGLPQTSGNPAESGTSNPIHMDFFGTGAYFHLLNSTKSRNEVWRYDIVAGGFVRYAQINIPTSGGQQNEDIIFFQNGAFVSMGTNAAQNDRVYGQQAAFSATATLDTSDLNLGQPYISNVWPRIELTFSPLAAGEAVAVAYSTDAGATYTSTDVASTTMSTTTLGAKSATWRISNSSATTNSPYVRLRVTLTAGTSQLTAPALRTVGLTGFADDPDGQVIECWLSCPDRQTMPNGQDDFQGASGAERLQNIITLYESGNLASVIYMAPGTTRAKNPTTISANVEDYEIWYYSPQHYQAGTGESFGVQGDVRVVLREVA